MKVISIGTDRKLFDSHSAVRARIIGYAKEYEEYHVIVFSGRGLPEKLEIAPNVFLYATNSSSRFGYIRDAIRIGRSILRTQNIDAKELLITCQDAAECGLVGYTLHKDLAESELELQIHTDIYSPYFKKLSILNYWRVRVADRVLPKADRIRVVSKRIKNSIIERLDIASEKIYVKPIFVDISKIQESPIVFDLHKEYPQFSFIGLMVSRLEKEKDIPLAIHAWKEATEKKENYGLIIVGSGREEKKLLRLVEKLDMAKQILFLPWQSDTISLFKSADLFLNTSQYEGYGMTLVEAHAAGLPIISTDVGIANELEGIAICPVGDKKCLITEIKRHLNSHL